jgi:hypothetical protein
MQKVYQKTPEVHRRSKSSWRTGHGRRTRNRVPVLDLKPRDQRTVRIASIGAAQWRPVISGNRRLPKNGNSVVM